METKYLRMIQGMKKKGRKDWTVYILRCVDGSLYTGIAKDVQARIKQHSGGRGAAYTRSRLPVTLLYQESGFNRSEALIREAQIKAMPRSKKKEIISNVVGGPWPICPTRGRRSRPRSCMGGIGNLKDGDCK